MIYFHLKVCMEEEEVELTAIASGAHGEDCRYVGAIKDLETHQSLFTPCVFGISQLDRRRGKMRGG